MKTKTSLRTALAAAFFVALLGFRLAGAAGAPEPDRPPNILFIFTDDHGDQAISAYGGSLNETPNLDRLAREGMLFRNCYVTNSICGPSRAVILTGKHSRLNGFLRNGMTFDGAQQTFPKILRARGYQTAVIGKWHLGSAPAGFDHSEILIGQGPYYNPPMLLDGERVEHTGYTTDIVTDKALAWLRTGRDPDKPFMLMCQHKAPHRNWQPSPAHLAMYDDSLIPEPATLFDDYATRGTAAHDEWELYDLAEDPDELRNVFDDPAYASVVSDMKAELERLREHYRVPEDTLPMQDL